MSSSPFSAFVWPAQQLPVTLASQPPFKPPNGLNTWTTNDPKNRLPAAQQCDLPLKSIGDISTMFEVLRPFPVLVFSEGDSAMRLHGHPLVVYPGPNLLYLAML